MKSNRKQMEAMVRARVESRNRAIALGVANRARQLCPIDTGRLRRSITPEADADGWTVSTALDYAPYVELGTRYQAPQPFLGPAFREVEGRLERMYTE